MAGARLLGVDVVTTVSEETMGELASILSDDGKVRLLVDHMSRFYVAENAVTYIESLLGQFNERLGQ